MTSAVIFKNVSKEYNLGSYHKSLREELVNLFKRFSRQYNDDEQNKKFLALEDINFTLDKGKVLGITGPNGAGKTTLLKLLSRVTKPSSGKISVEGRVSALIELGAGFHPDLTGRDNIYLNGIILGLSKHEIDNKFKSIIEFAELEKFIDTPVKRYSSGMYARLGFSVAIHSEPDILLVDEVLAVGDTSFQRKCLDFIHSFVKSGHTSIFVSHNLYAIEQLCDNVIWLDKGKIVKYGNPSKVLRAYMDETDKRMTRKFESGSNQISDRLNITNLIVTNMEGKKQESFISCDNIFITLEYEMTDKTEKPFFVVWISDTNNSTSPIFAANMLLDNYDVIVTNGLGRITCHFKEVPLTPRAYNIWVEAYGQDRSKILYEWRVLGGFRVVEDLKNGMDENRGSIRFSRAHSLVNVQYEWLPDRK